MAVKLNPYFSAMGNMALRMKNAGADALVLFNRFYQPDFDINELVINTDLHYSESSEIRLPLLWIALLYGKVKLVTGRYYRCTKCRGSSKIYSCRSRCGDDGFFIV